jgi:hypothetical protein
MPRRRSSRLCPASPGYANCYSILGLQLWFTKCCSSLGFALHLYSKKKSFVSALLQFCLQIGVLSLYLGVVLSFGFSFMNKGFAGKWD